jgi:glycosyltransferase involved in cell wall biosynthesis
VAALLAAGVPTVVPDLGPMTELPDDVVVKVDAAGGAAGLGEVIAGLLSDREGRDACSQSARDYAKASSFASAAESLLEVLFA